MRKDFLNQAFKKIFFFYIPFLTCLIGISSCGNSFQKPLRSLNSSLIQSANSHREPSLASEWLITLANHQGKELIEVINLRSKKKVALPGLNRADTQPISVSISGNGERIALVRQRGNKTELLVYRRNTETVQLIEINPTGIPRKVSMDGTGKLLAVQVSRGGNWEIDLIRIP